MDGNYAVKKLTEAIKKHYKAEFKEIIHRFKQDYERIPMYGCITEGRDLGLNKSYKLTPNDKNRKKRGSIFYVKLTQDELLLYGDYGFSDATYI